MVQALVAFPRREVRGAPVRWTRTSGEGAESADHLHYCFLVLPSVSVFSLPRLSLFVRPFFRGLFCNTVMATVKKLVEAECGGSNALVRAAGHFTTNQLAQRGLPQQGPGHHGPVGHVDAPQLAGRNAFDMRHLIHDMKHMEAPQVVHTSPLVKPTFTASQWSHEFASNYPSSSVAAGPSAVTFLPGTSLQEKATYGNVSGREGSMFAPTHPMSRPLFTHLRPQPFMHPIEQATVLNQSSQKYQLAEEILSEQESKLHRKSEEAKNQNHSAILNEARKVLDSVTVDPKLKSKFEEAADRITSKESKGKTEVKEKDDLAFWNNLASEWEAAAQENESINDWLGNYDSVSDPFKDGYFFKDDNPLKETLNAFEEGLKKLNEGDIPSAVLLFEAACQQEPQNALAWQYLGTTQAKNEHDPAAIRALRKALELEPGNLTSLMALAVSYTNEAYQKQACDSLLQWLKCNPVYRHLAASISPKEGKDLEPTHFVSSFASASEITQIKNAFIGAARMQPSNPDPDVQSGLGVLFNLSGEYDKAVDCFTSALSVRPADALLWNRLGATLANGSRSEEAIQAYRKALEISPGFIRCRFNLGISCVNLGAYNEAVEHFLAVLNFQNAGRGPAGETSRTSMSNNVWSSLRMVLSLMNRQDLYPAVSSKDLDKLNREFNMSDFLGQLRGKNSL